MGNKYGGTECSGSHSSKVLTFRKIYIENVTQFKEYKPRENNVWWEAFSYVKNKKTKTQLEKVSGMSESWYYDANCVSVPVHTCACVNSGGWSHRRGHALFCHISLCALKTLWVYAEGQRRGPFMSPFTAEGPPPSSPSAGVSELYVKRGRSRSCRTLLARNTEINGRFDSQTINMLVPPAPYALPFQENTPHIALICASRCINAVKCIFSEWCYSV